MNHRVAGLLALVVVLPGAVITRNDFRSGVARLWLSGGVVPIRAERAVSPTNFWVLMIMNWALIVLIAAAGIMLLVMA